jgi:hypothetical protein
MNNNSPFPISVSEAEAQVENRQVPSDDVEISSKERSRTLASSNDKERASWQQFSDCKLMVFLGAVTVATSVLVIILVCVGMSRSSSNATNMSPIRDSGTPTFEFPTIDETPRFGSPEFMEELRTVVGVDPLPGTPQRGALEWMASDDLELWDMKASRERLKQRYAPSGLPLLQDAGTRGVAGPLLPVLANMNATGPGVLRPRQCRSSSLRLDTFVGTLQGSIPSDIFSPLLVRVHEALVICCCSLNVDLTFIS